MIKTSSIVSLAVIMAIVVLWPSTSNGSADAAAPAPIEVAPGITLGWTGEIQCYNCAPFSATVKLSHYDPLKGPINCFDYEDGYCYSPTASGIHWKAVYGIGAACPPEWPFGTWVNIPGVGAFICFDRGEAIKCNELSIQGLTPSGELTERKETVCNVDILGPGGGAWDGGIYDVTLWVPLNPLRAQK